MLGPLDVAFDVVETLDQIKIDYVLCGSLASSTFGEPRATNDVDIAIVLTATDLGPLIDKFRAKDYYVAERSATQHANLDLGELRHDAREADLRQLLERALVDAGVDQ